VLFVVIPDGSSDDMILDISSVVKKALDAETEAKTEVAGFEAEAVAPRDQGRGSSVEKLRNL